MITKILRVKYPISSFMFLLMALFIFTGWQKNPPIKKGNETEAIPVRIMKVELKDIERILEYVGNIKAQDEVMVYPKVTGKVSAKTRQDGDIVNKGDVIAYIDRDEVGLKFEHAPVESPLNGIVGRVYVDIGASVTPQTPIAMVVNMDKVKINLDIPERYLPNVSLSQEAKITVDAYPKREFIGLVTKISPVVDLSTRTTPVEIIIDNKQHELKSGMFARVKLIIEQHKGVPVILKEALIGKEPDVWVYVVEDKKAILKKIGLGLRQGAYIEVRAGLKQGDMVVIMGQQRLYEGALVEPGE